ncbi:GntR family transcriptional regulator [Phycisphaera mikurensis]|uniref:GntR family transcriptional regulator n=1 Tax=Phycisphaera mikurensis (strain NBRC 102666 / KCTC 22515 / FYK2301M01) TaxID=1142394 RepID=I0IHL1_PHYMF|nr:GntR family transcriptional regulator [Phycisphaera mikurensis]MBB6440994.1 GntR family transcriptional regulator [Phycisphaera mikurensis]BAM04749.1 GntR family transcriptional regulator [Phycisphaera mikurensis NBRC 102666]
MTSPSSSSFHPEITTGGSVPIWLQVVRGVRLAVAQGRLQEGEAMPSVRAMAERLVVNPNTISKAYAELTREHTLVSQPGRGVFVAPPREVLSRKEKKRRLAEAAEELVHAAVEVDADPAEAMAALQKALVRLRVAAA